MAAPDHCGPPGPVVSPVAVLQPLWLRNSTTAPSCQLQLRTTARQFMSAGPCSISATKETITTPLTNVYSSWHRFLRPRRGGSPPRPVCLGPVHGWFKQRAEPGAQASPAARHVGLSVTSPTAPRLPLARADQHCVSWRTRPAGADVSSRDAPRSAVDKRRRRPRAALDDPGMVEQLVANRHGPRLE